MPPRKRRDWPEAANALAGIFPRERLDAAVMAWAAAAPRRQRWAVAFSGGVDSVALLLLLWAHWPERRGTLRALHFDHRLRGAASRTDAAFCRGVCAALNVDFVAGRWAEAHRDASEAEARGARMAFFREHGRVLWLGHQQDDIAESMLMRLARGSGAGGLAAPRPVQPHADGRVHLRPLLTLKKAELVEALRAVGAEWREDASNAAERFFRNRIRRTVVPAWAEAAQRDASGGAARSRQLLEEDDTALEHWLDTLRPLGRGGVLDVARLRGKPRALWRRALHRWLLGQPAAGDLSRQAFEALMKVVEEGRATRQSLGRDGFAVTDGERLWFEGVGKPRRRFRRRAN